MTTAMTTATVPVLTLVPPRTASDDQADQGSHADEAKQLRRAGQLLLRSLRATNDDINLAIVAAGVVNALACADCYGDPERGEIVVGAEALDALDDAEVALDDALVTASLERAGKRQSRGRAYTVADEARALQALNVAMERAQRAITRAHRLADDLERMPMLLQIALGARPHRATA